jgi:hypothetical protein
MSSQPIIAASLIQKPILPVAALAEQEREGHAGGLQAVRPAQGDHAAGERDAG